MVIEVPLDGVGLAALAALAGGAAAWLTRAAVERARDAGRAEAARDLADARWLAEAALREASEVRGHWLREADRMAADRQAAQALLEAAEAQARLADVRAAEMAGEARMAAAGARRMCDGLAGLVDRVRDYRRDPHAHAEGLADELRYADSLLAAEIDEDDDDGIDVDEDDDDEGEVT